MPVVRLISVLRGSTLSGGLIEFGFDSPRGQRTAASVNPGLAYIGETCQVSAEALLPLNRDGGSGAGARLQILFFIDDIAPSLFGKPLLSEQRVISRVETFGSP
ncbi:MAG: hypothetical protein ACLP7P_02620 [Rhodomicrobium sp.]